jgi:large subunit ribosomal protein L33
MPRDKVILECTDCKSRNYFTTKNKRKHPERMETRKFCPRCGTHRGHRESK